MFACGVFGLVWVCSCGVPWGWLVVGCVCSCVWAGVFGVFCGRAKVCLFVFCGLLGCCLCVGVVWCLCGGAGCCLACEGVCVGV